jgi:hypothetical protein
MPYKVFEENEKYCVYKVNADGEKSEKVACHDTEEKAKDQITAINMSESESGKSMHMEETEPMPMKEVSYNQIILDAEKEFMGKYDSGYVMEVYKEYMIVVRDGKLWKAPYSMSEEGCKIVDMPNWTEVQLDINFVNKFANELTAVKSVVVNGEEYVQAYGAIWGSTQERDLHKEWFSKSTQEMTSIFEQMGKIPYLFQHGADGVIKSTVIGEVTEMTTDDIGLWYRARVREHEAYKRMVKPLLEERKLFSSSGVLPAAKKVNKMTGEITRWPIIEITATHTPAEHRMLDMPIERVNKMYKSMGLPGFDVDADDGASEKDGWKLRTEQARLRNRYKQLTLDLN